MARTANAGLVLAMASGGVLAGCGGSGPASLTPADFGGGSGDAPSVAASGAEADPEPVYSIERSEVPTSMLLGASDVAVAQPGPPVGVAAGADASEDEPGTAADGVVLDAKVGDVNGRPIIASVFLEDLMPRLRASMQTAQSRTAWRREAILIISEKLALTIRDEVLYREAQSQLPDAVQRVGLRHFLSRFREQVRLQNAGSVSRADELVREQYGKSLDEYLQDQQRQAVIASMLNETDDFAPVTWTDIRNEYARRYAEFNPPPTVFARMILPPGDAEAELVRERLAGGEAFVEVAEERTLNRYRPTSGGLIDDEGTRVEGDLSSARLVGFDSLNAALVELEPGAWAGPIEYRGGRQGFVALDRIEQPTRRSLDEGELQLELRAEIEFRRRREARERFLRELIDDAGFGEEQQMEIAFALLRIAEARLAVTGG